MFRSIINKTFSRENEYVNRERSFLKIWLIADIDMSHTQTFVTRYTVMQMKYYINNKILLLEHKDESMLSQQHSEECSEHNNDLLMSEPCFNKKHNRSSRCKQSKTQNSYDVKPKWMRWLCLENWFAVF